MKKHSLLAGIIKLLQSKSVFESRRLISLPEFETVSKYGYLKNRFTQTRLFKDNYVEDRFLNLVYNRISDIGNLLYTTGKFEEDEILYSSEIIKREGSCTVLDIGANVGLHTINWSKKCPDASFIVFEPTRTIFDVLIRSLNLNKLDSRVIAVNKAVSDYSGEADFFETADDAYNSLKDTKRKKVLDRYKVDVITIDDYVEKNRIKNLKFIKIDTEGFEDQVIKGALNTISGQKPVLFIEIYGGLNSNPNPSATVKFLIKMGYDAFVRKEGKLIKFSEHSDSWYNYFFFPKNKEHLN